MPFGNGNTTDWPLDGGSLELELHHPWTYIFIHAGLGENTTDFNITLTPDLWNSTSEGTLCIEKLPIPEDSGIKNGSIGSLQVITLDAAGSSLYNCADIRFVDNAPEAPTCNGTVGVNIIKGNSSTTLQEGSGHDHGDDHSEEESGGDEESSGGDDDGAAGMIGVNMVSLTTFTGLAAVFVMGLGL